MTQHSIEERLSILESKMAAMELAKAELELAKQQQETRDLALLARIDGFIDDLRRVERVQMKAFDHQALQLNEVRDGMKQIQETQASLVSAVELHEKNILVLGEAAKEHKATLETLYEGQQALQTGQQALQTGQEQILAILTGQAKTND